MFIFLALGYRKSYDSQHGRWETARVLNSCWQASRNIARSLVMCLGWGDAKNFKESGETPGIEHTRHGAICHHWCAKLSICSTEARCINAIASKCNATRPVLPVRATKWLCVSLLILELFASTSFGCDCLLVWSVFSCAMFRCANFQFCGICSKYPSTNMANMWSSWKGCQHSLWSQWSSYGRRAFMD